MTETLESNVPPQEPSPPVQPPAPSETSEDERKWAMFCHLAGLAGLTGVPIASVVGPLIIWLIKKEEFPLVDREGKKALNFQITLVIAAIICIPLILVFIGFILLLAVTIVWLVYTILAAVRTSEGKNFEYPFSIKFFK